MGIIKSNVSVRQESGRDKKLIFFGVLLAFAFWIMEALIHAFIFQEGELLRKLFPTDPNEVWMRTLVCCLFILFGIYANSSRVKLEKSEEERLALQQKIILDVSVQQERFKGGPMIFLGLFAALAFWIIEALIHTAIFHEGDLRQNIFPEEPNELWMRILVSCLFIALGIYAHSSITKLIKSEKERLRLQKELENSLTNLLGGFVPICAYCKNSRQEDGTWIRIEGYIEKRSEVKFSHGICEKCMERLYPE